MKQEKLLIGGFIAVVVILISIFSFTDVLRTSPGEAHKAVSPKPTTFEQNFYVDNQNELCTDQGEGTQSTPFCSINKAILEAEPGDTISVYPGTYDISQGEGVEYASGSEYPLQPGQPMIRPINSGTANYPIRLIGMSTAKDIIGKGNYVNDDDNQVFVIGGTLLMDKDYWDVEGLYFTHGGGVYTIENTGFVLKDSLFFVDPEPHTDLINVNGGHTLYVMRTTDTVFDHLEVWSINFDSGMDANFQTRCGQDSAYETQSKCVQNWGSTGTVLKNSFVYGCRYLLQRAGEVVSSGCVVENNHLMFAEEHNGHFCTDDFVYRRNFNFMGQQTPYFEEECNGPLVTGVIENNVNYQSKFWMQQNCNEDHWLNNFDYVKFRNNIVVLRTSVDACFYAGPQYENVIDSDFNLCSPWFRNDPTQPKGTFWSWYAGGYDDIQQWIGANTESPYLLDAWKVQDDVPEITQDDNSLFRVDPGFITPIQEFGQFENIDYSCSATFGHPDIFGECYSNCEAPYRIRFLDDTHLRSDSPLIDRGDPDYGTNYPGGRIDIGMYEYDDDIPPPPQECTLQSADWSELQVQDGDTVTLTATGSDCAGEDITFTIFNLMDNSVETTLTSEFLGSTGMASWNAVYHEEYPSTIYYFVVSAADDSMQSENNLMVEQVSEPPGEDEEPTNIFEDDYTTDIASNENIAEFTNMAWDGDSSYLPLGGSEISPDSQGLVALWHFNDDLSDEISPDASGNGHSASCSGSQCPSIATGRFGNGYVFDGSDDFLQVTNTDGFAFGNAFSVSLWIKPAAENPWEGWSPYIIGNYDGTSGFAIRPASTGLRCNVVSQTGILSCNNVGSPTTDEWSHLVLVYDGQTLTLYKNGVPNEKDIGSANYDADPLHNLFIGSNFGSQHFFNGVIDEVGIWNRVLAPAEVQALYEGTGGGIEDASFISTPITTDATLKSIGVDWVETGSGIALDVSKNGIEWCPVIDGGSVTDSDCFSNQFIYRVQFEEQTALDKVTFTWQYLGSSPIIMKQQVLPVTKK